MSCALCLQVVGLYRLCGSAAVKKELREAFERDSKAVTLCESQYPDINVITGNTFTCFSSAELCHVPHVPLKGGNCALNSFSVVILTSF